MTGFRLTPRALADLKSIGRYTTKQWGKARRNSYLKSLDERFHWLAENPRAGRSRDDIASGYRCFAQGQHLVFYRTHCHGIDIIGVVHQAMDVKARIFDDV